MKILVIGGSYFFGRWFVQVTYKDHDITLLNRGNIKTGLAGVRELVCDRHDPNGLKELDFFHDAYDVVVDFCAYEKGDIEGVLKYLNTDILHKYIFISTVDVYKRESGVTISEDAPFADDFEEGVQGAYIAGKVALERELAQAGKRYGIKCVSVRPAVLYGPLNYAPRESVYFEWIKRAGQIIHPIDSDGFWQMIYIEDAARALKVLCECPDREIYEAYNFCNGERVTYEVFEEALKAIGKPFEKVGILVSDVDKDRIPLPFPLRECESAFYSADRFNDICDGYTPLPEGLKRTENIQNS